MRTVKLILRVEEEVAERAKKYVKEHGTTLSSLVENYFRTLTGSGNRSNRKRVPLTPIVQELAGILPAKAGYRWKQARADYLIKKHLRT